MTPACPTVQALLAHVAYASPTLIGIDGLDGCRKSTVAQRLAGHTNHDVVSLDSFLGKNKGKYVDFIDLNAVREAVRDRTAILEGVCLLDVVERAGLKLYLLIYVQRIHHGIWVDEDWLGLNQNLEEYLRRLNIATAIVSGEEEAGLEEGLSTEIIRYHHAFRPLSRGLHIHPAHQLLAQASSGVLRPPTP